MTARLVLLGGGHAHVEVVRRFGARPVPGAEIVLVSPSTSTPYSGMLPGHVAGHYRFEDFHIDVRSLSARSGVRFVEGEAIGIETADRRVRLGDGTSLAYDLLSLDIGSRPVLPDGVTGGIAVKPISTFAERLPGLDQRARASNGPYHLAVVGQGVAGIEITFALHRRLGRARVTLLGRSDHPLPERGALARRMVARALRQTGIATLAGFDVVAFEGGVLTARDGRTLSVDEAVWTTSSVAPAWLADTGLALDERGFVRVDALLRSVSHPGIFAAGDVAALPEPRAKSGVIAVRAGPVLAANLVAALKGRSLTAFRPQRHWLALISLADGRAVADKWGLAATGRWVCAWKHWNDTAFVKRYADPNPRTATELAAP